MSSFEARIAKLIHYNMILKVTVLYKSLFLLNFFFFVNSLLECVPHVNRSLHEVG